MATVVLDTSAVLGLLDREDPNHDGAARSIRASRAAGQQIVVPALVLAEVLVAAGRLGQDAATKTEEFVDAMVDDVHDLDRRVAREAAACVARHPDLPLRAAVVIAVGRVRGAETILTADPAWRPVDRRVRVISRSRA